MDRNMLDRRPMPLVTLRDLYAAELHDLFDAEQQILQELPGMAARATSAELRQAFEDHYEQTQVHLDRLELLFRQLDERPRVDVCEGMHGVIQEAHRRAADAERGDVLVAALIAAAQRIEHYEIAAYGCVRSYAQTPGDAEAARLLQQTLDEEERADRRLTEIAEQRINHAAGEDLVPHPTTYRSRLRYVSAGDLGTFPYARYRITTPDHEDIGAIDGFIVDGDSARPVYYVVDSGGWFTGRRYLLPVAQLELDEREAMFHTELTREQLRRYPEFSTTAFVAMNDDEAARYERRMLETVVPFRHQSHRAAERPAYGELPMYQPPAWLMTGVWPTEATGFAVVPPRSQSSPAGHDGHAKARSTKHTTGTTGPDKEGESRNRRKHAPHDDMNEREHEAALQAGNELMVARGEPEGRSEEAPKRTKRIEKYEDR
jgi:ferritin-like metal-binding protein YciE